MEMQLKDLMNTSQEASQIWQFGNISPNKSGTGFELHMKAFTGTGHGDNITRMKMLKAHLVSEI